MCECEHAGLREKLAGSMGYEKNEMAAVRRGKTADSSRGKNPGTNDSRKVRRQQARRVTTATPEQSQERSDERALAEAQDAGSVCLMGARLASVDEIFQVQRWRMQIDFRW